MKRNERVPRLREEARLEDEFERHKHNADGNVQHQVEEIVDDPVRPHLQTHLQTPHTRPFNLHIEQER
jgi:hypothetical protein